MFRNTQLEVRTFRLMIGMYCRAHHGEVEDGGNAEAGGFCGPCASLMAFTEGRIRHCPRGPHKFQCGKCATRCYKEPFRSDLRRVMRYAGPRMLLRHPLLTIRHLLAGL